MSNLRSLVAAGLLCILAACTNKDISSPTMPDGEIPRPSVAAPPPYASPYCTWKDAAEIERLIGELYFKNQWPDPNSALSKFRQVTNALAADNLDLARTNTKALVAFISNKFNSLTPAEKALTQAEYDSLIADIWCFVGISGVVFDLNPTDPAKLFTIPGVGGVWFPPNAVPIGTMVVLTNLNPLFPTNGDGPLTTFLDQWSSYINIELIPSHTFTPPILPIVFICPLDGSPPDLYLGHQDPVTGFELLAPADVSQIPELGGVCTGTSGQSEAGQSWLAQWVHRAATLLLPRQLQASPLLLGGAVFGSPIRFSPFVGISYSGTGTNGTSGTPLRFTPPAQTNRPEGAPVLDNPPLPEHYVSGAVGTDGNTSDPEWPYVTIKTKGGDWDGQNPIPGVTVTFTIGDTDDFEPDSEAEVCNAQGTVQASVSVVTDANGKAVLPCLKFGNVAGFANLEATWDPSTVGFPGDELLEITSSATSNTLNWLVKSNAGVPSALTFVTSPSTTGTAGVALASQPAVQLLDALGNEVYADGFDVTVSISSGGGTLGGTTTVGTDDGVATFSGISVGGAIAGVAQTLSFSFTGITTPLTSSVTVTAGAANKVAITQQPSSTASAGQVFATQPKVTLQDQFGNTVSSTGNAVASLASGAGTLAGTATVAAVGGVATFTNLRIDGLTGDRTLSFTLGGFTSPASNTISVGAGTATQLVITQQPSSTASAGVAFPTQPIVAIRDAFGNTANSTANVTAAIATGGGTLGGTAMVAAVAGVTTFSGLSIGGTIGARTLQFTSGALPAATSNSITVGAGPAASVLTSMPPSADAATFTYPGTVTANAAISPVPRAIVKDQYGNILSGQGVTWTAVNSIVSPGSSSTNSNGFASVTSWTPGVGESTLLASIDPNISPATFVATAAIPTSGNVFMCELGTADNNFVTVGPSNTRGKTALAPIRVVDPKKSITDFFFYMSVNGQSNSFATYPVSVSVYRTGGTATDFSGPAIATATGTVALPGDNGKPQLQHITFSSAVPAGTANNQALWFVITPGPTPRDFTLWHTTGIASNKLSNDCKASFVKTGTTSFQMSPAVLLRN